ncbi:MAG: DNA topoisomerase [Lachnospiraceae bacterium]
MEKTELTAGKTKPPARFNEATLLSAMENPVKYMESRDKTYIRTLGETGGLGTVATRADIIDKLFKSFLMEKKGKRYLHYLQGPPASGPGTGGSQKPELTASWELKLGKIAREN